MDIVKKIILWLIIALLLIGTCLGIYFGIKYKNLNQTQVEDNIELVTTITDLRKNISALEKEKANFVVQVNELKENNKELTNSLSNETKDNALLRDQIEKNNTLIARLEENIANLQNQIADLNRQIVVLQNENNNLQSEIDSFNTLTPITLDFTQEQLQNANVKNFLAGKDGDFGVSTFVSVKGSFIRDNQCVIVSNIIDGYGQAGLGYTCFVYDVKKELNADYVVELMQDGEIFIKSLISFGVCCSIKSYLVQSDYFDLIDYYNNHKTISYKLGKNLYNIDELFIKADYLSNMSERTYKYSIIGFGDEIPTLYLDGVEKFNLNMEKFIIHVLGNFEFENFKSISELA